MRVLPLATVIITACDPFVVSQIELTPSASTSPASIHSRAVAIVDSLARQHGLKTQQWPYSCTIGRSEGTRAGSWENGPLWLTVCVERSHPDRLQVFMKEPGFTWNAKGDSLRLELRRTLQQQFGPDMVAVER